MMIANFPIPVNRKEISDVNIKAALNILVDNGIEDDEAETVLQAIGYALLNTELFPESEKASTEADDIIRAYDHYEYGDGNPLFFYCLGNAVQMEKKAAVIADFVKKLNEMYCALFEDSTDWALEFHLWIRMLLSNDAPHIMLNPRHLERDSVLVNEVSEFISKLCKPEKRNNAISAYRRLVNANSKLLEAWKQSDSRSFCWSSKVTDRE